MRSSYTVSITDSKGTEIYQTLISDIPDGWTYPFTAAGSEEFVYSMERSIKEHEAHLETTAKTEYPL